MVISFQILSLENPSKIVEVDVQGATICCSFFQIIISSFSSKSLYSFRTKLSATKQWLLFYIITLLLVFLDFPKSSKSIVNMLKTALGTIQTTLAKAMNLVHKLTTNSHYKSKWKDDSPFFLQPTRTTRTIQVSSSQLCWQETSYYIY